VFGSLKTADGLLPVLAIGCLPRFLPTVCPLAVMRAARRRPHKGSLGSFDLPSVSIQRLASPPSWHRGCTCNGCE
jgi:hypothetical protein